MSRVQEFRKNRTTLCNRLLINKVMFWIMYNPWQLWCLKKQVFMTSQDRINRLTEEESREQQRGLLT